MFSSTPVHSRRLLLYQVFAFVFISAQRGAIFQHHIFLLGAKLTRPPNNGSCQATGQQHVHLTHCHSRTLPFNRFYESRRGWRFEPPGRHHRHGRLNAGSRKTLHGIAADVGPDVWDCRQDILLLGIATALLFDVTGPWRCAATVINLRSMGLTGASRFTATATNASLPGCLSGSVHRSSSAI